jgi:homoprotocatechuate degradation regulator HpaR
MASGGCKVPWLTLYLTCEINHPSTLPDAPLPIHHRNLPRLLLQAREAVMAHTRPWLRSHGLSDQQWRVLRVLGECGRVETGRIAREAFIPSPSLTGVLARMERDGLIHRARATGDQRRTEVEVTAKGRRLTLKLVQAVQEHNAWMEARLGPKKLHQLTLLLHEVALLENNP